MGVHNPCRVTQVNTASGLWEVSTTPGPGGDTVALGPQGEQIDFGRTHGHQYAVRYMQDHEERETWPRYHYAPNGETPPAFNPDRCRLCDAHVSEPHDPTCAVGIAADLAEWADGSRDLTELGEITLRAGASL